MQIKHVCGFWYDENETIDAGNITFNKALGCLIGYVEDVPKLQNLNEYLEEGAIFMTIDSNIVKIYSKVKNTWYDFLGGDDE